MRSRIEEQLARAKQRVKDAKNDFKIVREMYCLYEIEAAETENELLLALARYVSWIGLSELTQLGLDLDFNLLDLGYKLEPKYDELLKLGVDFSLDSLIMNMTRYNCCDNGHFYRMS